MSKSLADLRAAGAPARPERSKTLCLAPNLVAEVQSLSNERVVLSERLAVLRSQEKREQDGPQRIGDGSKRREVEELEARDQEICDRLTVLLEEMAAHEGEIRVRANLSDGEWRRFCNDHPARAEGDPGVERDDRVTGGFCNADDLLDSLGLFVHTWEGEILSPADWDALIEPRTASADKVEMAQLVVAMYEQSLDFRQWRSALQGSLKRLSDSASPATSEAPTSDSTAGSLDSSTAATTSTATESA